MTHNLTLFCLKKAQAKSYLTEDEYNNVAYFLEVLLINIFKGLQVYSAALILGVLKETFVINVSYALLRKYAGGWHAKSSLNCSLMSVSLFVGLPFLIVTFNVTLSFIPLIIISLFLFIGVYKYAPADTEKNPLVSVSDRKKRRKNSISVLLIVTVIMLVYPNPIIRTLILLGLITELIMIHPLYFHLTKQDYNNYLKYENID